MANDRSGGKLILMQVPIHRTGDKNMFKQKVFAVAAVAVAIGLPGLVVPEPASAGMFDMMNPSRWFGGNRDYYDDDYRYGYGRGRYGYGGPYGWGGGPYGWGGGPYGWGGGYPGYGYGYPYGVVPGAGTTQKQAPPRLPE